MLTSIPWSLHLRKIRPDIALDLQGLLRSALMARLSRAGRAIGISDAREGATRLYHEVVPVIRGEHAVLRYLRVLGSLGLPKVERPVFPLPPGVPLDAPFRDQPFVVLHPFARGEGKSLAPEHVVQFCERVRPLTTRPGRGRKATAGIARQYHKSAQSNHHQRDDLASRRGRLRRQRGQRADAHRRGRRCENACRFTHGATRGWWVHLATRPGFGRADKFGASKLGRTSLPPARLPHGDDIVEIADFVRSVRRRAAIRAIAGDFGGALSGGAAKILLFCSYPSNSSTIARSSFSSLTLASILALAKSLRGTPWTISIFVPSDRVGNEQIRPFSIP